MSTWKKMSITVVGTLAVVALVGAVAWAQRNGTRDGRPDEEPSETAPTKPTGVISSENTTGAKVADRETEAGEPTWHTSMKRALAEAGKKDAPVLVDFYADWCGWCKKMEKETFSDSEVRAQMRDFVLLKINTDEQPDLARRYEVRGLPTTLILNSEGKVVVKQPGYMPPEDYLKLLDRAG